MAEPVEQVDVLAVGAHPDDVEIACGGTLAKLVQQGHRVGIIDLTDGEPTPLSPGPEVRLAEARRAAEVLGAVVRVTLDLPNRRLFDSFEARVALAKEFRKYRPRLVIGLGAGTPLASPDHGQAGKSPKRRSSTRGCRSGTSTSGPCRPTSCRPCSGVSWPSGSLLPERHGIVVDISDVLEKKMAAIACYETQFPPVKAGHLDGIRAYAQQQGMAAGFAAGEVLASPGAWGTRDLMALVFG